MELKGKLTPEMSLRGIISKTADVSSVGGVQYTSIIYSDDDTITLTGIDGIAHIMTCTYEDDKLIGVTYDGKPIELTYKDKVIKVGKTMVDLEGALDYVLKATLNFQSDVNFNEGDVFEFKSTATPEIASFFEAIKDDSTFLLSVDGGEAFEVSAVYSEGWIVLFNWDTLSGVGYNPLTNELGIQMNEDDVMSGSHTITLYSTLLLSHKLHFQNGFILGSSSGGVIGVIDTTEIDNLENLIDNSGTLDSTEGTTKGKIEQLIDKAEDDNLWYAASRYIVIDNQKTFKSPTYTKKTIPRIDFSEMTSLRYSFNNYDIEYIGYYINSKKCTNFSSCFYNSAKLKTMVGVDTSSAINVSDMLSLSGIETIQEPFDFSNVTSCRNCFNCSNLKDIEFKAKTIKVSIVFTSAVLSAKSVKSIIDGLATIETAQTLTLNSAITLTDEQKATINAKGWTLAQ